MDSEFTFATGNSLSSQVTIEDIKRTLRAFPKMPLEDWRRVDSPYVPKTSRVWVPPTDPFIEFEESDHPWLKKLGFGSYEERPVVYFINHAKLSSFMQFDFRTKEPRR